MGGARNLKLARGQRKGKDQRTGDDIFRVWSKCGLHSVVYKKEM